MTNRGLRVSLHGRVVTHEDQRGWWDDDGPRAEYVLFTGFSFKDNAVCVCLVQDEWTGPECYTQLDSRVKLVHPLDLAERFTPQPIYLSTAQQPSLVNASGPNTHRSLPIHAHLLTKTLSPKYTDIAVAWVAIRGSGLPVTLESNSSPTTGAEPDSAVFRSWTGTLLVRADDPGHHALDVTIQKEAGQL